MESDYDRREDGEEYYARNPALKPRKYDIGIGIDDGNNYDLLEDVEYAKLHPKKLDSAYLLMGSLIETLQFVEGDLVAQQIAKHRLFPKYSRFLACRNYLTNITEEEWARWSGRVHTVHRPTWRSFNDKVDERESAKYPSPNTRANRPPIATRCEAIEDQRPA